MRDGLPQLVNTPELRFECDEARKFQIVEEVGGAAGQGRRQTDRHIDGVRVSTPDGWWLPRLQYPGRPGGAAKAPTRPVSSVSRATSRCFRPRAHAGPA